MSQPTSGTVTIGKTPLWAMLVDAELERRKKWDELRAKGWFTLADIQERSGWSRPVATAWAQTQRFKGIVVYNPETSRLSTLYDPKSGVTKGRLPDTRESVTHKRGEK